MIRTWGLLLYRVGFWHSKHLSTYSEQHSRPPVHHVYNVCIYLKDLCVVFVPIWQRTILGPDKSNFAINIRNPFGSPPTLTRTARPIAAAKYRLGHAQIFDNI